jgi:hypothetical protein
VCPLLGKVLCRHSVMSCVDFQLLAAGVAVSTMRREKGTEDRVFTTVEHHKTQARDDVLLFHGQPSLFRRSLLQREAGTNYVRH